MVSGGTGVVVKVHDKSILRKPQARKNEAYNYLIQLQLLTRLRLLAPVRLERAAWKSRVISDFDFFCKS